MEGEGAAAASAPVNRAEEEEVEGGRGGGAGIWRGSSAAGNRREAESQASFCFAAGSFSSSPFSWAAVVSFVVSSSSVEKPAALCGLGVSSCEKNGEEAEEAVPSREARGALKTSAEEVMALTETIAVAPKRSGIALVSSTTATAVDGGEEKGGKASSRIFELACGRTSSSTSVWSSETKVSPPSL